MKTIYTILIVFAIIGFVVGFLAGFLIGLIVSAPDERDEDDEEVELWLGECEDDVD